MSRDLSRAAAGTLGIIVAAAVTNVAVARAQQAVSTDPGGVPAVSTDCGGGTIEQCSTQKTFKCSWDIGLSYNPVTRGFDFSFKETCVESGSRPIYKDKERAYVPHGGCVLRTDVPEDDSEACI